MSVELINPYCTLDELKRELKRSAVDVSIDDDLSDAINSASRFIDQYCRRDWYYHDYTSTPLEIDEYDEGYVPGGAKLYLQYRIIDLQSVQLGMTPLIVTKDYVYKTVNDSSMLISLNGGWLLNRAAGDALQLTGTFGYIQSSQSDVPTALPGYISLACRLIAAAFSGWNRKDVIGLDGSKSEITDREIPKLVYSILPKPVVV